ncbi:outer membrane protein [Maritalea myrionectae]|uniref:outer membrane protein n=1 Tax=Maritalea myrionectae TaxID=454601 RepID=UPI0004147164|nr:outer membrane beta-barrel protein [Maritalea myrionectae]
MSLFKTSILITTSTLLMSGAALAADPVEYPPLPEEYESNGFDWDGFYAGIGLSGSSLSNDTNTVNRAYVDAIIGFNATYNDFLVGVEGWANVHDAINIADYGYGIGVEGRMGYLVTDSVLVYGGIGQYLFDGGALYSTAGIGTEFAISDEMSLDLEYKYWYTQANDYSGHSLGASALWHF